MKVWDINMSLVYHYILNSDNKSEVHSGESRIVFDLERSSNWDLLDLYLWSWMPTWILINNRQKDFLYHHHQNKADQTNF